MTYEITNITGPVVEQDWQNETTRYWFGLELDGDLEHFCVAESGGLTQILDADGAPITEGDYLEAQVRRYLKPLVDAQIYGG